MKKLEIFLFGNFQVHLNGTEITDLLRTRKERALLAYLAEEPAILQTREKIAEFLWPNRPENYARMNLRQALLGLRKTIEGEKRSHNFFEITDETVEFSHKNVWLDTKTFSNNLQVIKQHPHHELQNCPDCLDKMVKAVEIYRGDFLSDLFLNEVTAFQEWAIFQRERHFRNLINALQTLSKAFYFNSNMELAYKYAYRYVEMAPLEESAHRLLMRLLTINRRRTAALQQYQLCKSIIKNELGIEPSMETQRLYEKIQNNQPIERIDTGSLNGKLVSSQGKGSELTTEPLYDPYTAIPLRMIFMDRLHHALVRTKRNQTNAAIVLLSLSFPMNPDLKPDQKDQVDTLLVRRMIGSVREDDTIARMQEDEYGIILEDIKDPAVIPMIIQKIKTAVSSPLQLPDLKIQTQVALGWSACPLDGFEVDGLLSKAEVAMRTEKMIGNKNPSKLA